MSDKIRLIYNKIENRIDEICDDGFVSKENQQEYETLTDLEDFIDSFPKEPTSEDLIEEIDKIWKTCNPIDEGMGVETANIHIEQFDDIARHFAEWQKNKMKEALQTEYEKGRFDMREEMMKDAIDGKITLDLDGNISLDCSDVLYVGDKVKINKITMSKIAEQMALETYPKPAEEHSGFITKETFNVSKRIGYVKGYDQACSDIKSKVQDLIDGLRKNNPNPFGNESELMAASEIEALNMILDIIDKN